jgi:hypothetical protein
MPDTKTIEQGPARELERAEREVEEVLERIKAGDEKVKPEDLESADSRLRFARARLEGAERRQAEEAERKRLQNLRAVKERVAKELDPAPIHKLREKAAVALDAYIAACVSHNARLDEIAHLLLGLEPLPKDWAVRDGSDGVSLTAAGQDVWRLRPMVEVSAIAHEKLRAHLPGYIDLEQPY